MKSIILLFFTFCVFDGYAADDDVTLIDVVRKIQREGPCVRYLEAFIDVCQKRRLEVLSGNLLSEEEQKELALFFIKENDTYPHPKEIGCISYEEYLKRIEPFLEEMKKGKEQAIREGHRDDFGYEGYMDSQQIQEKVFKTEIVKGGTPVKVGKNTFIIPRHDFDWEMEVTAPKIVREWRGVDRCPNLLRPLFGLAPSYPFTKKEDDDEQDQSDQDDSKMKTFKSPQRKVNLHHSSKIPEGEVIFSVPSVVHKDKTSVLHQGGSERPSKIIRSVFNKEKIITYQALALRVMIVDFESFMRALKMPLTLEEENTQEDANRILFQDEYAESTKQKGIFEDVFAEKTDDSIMVDEWENK